MWGATADNGLYAPANKFPPSFKPTKQMLLLKRRIYGLVTQFRTGHAFTGEYYRHSVPDNPRSCTCGEPLETREHIMFVCPTYEEHRHLLEKVSPDHSSEEIFGTWPGIKHSRASSQ
ncbi:hypothetical protein BOTBODRAFT_36153 [Botryobasidium botryosum FD-172 SS1]|uniref:Reverse transcriptase zinc-binding domain-containing protein n=1 Tax=Botryobasidium botryosum (strain FD-172 SS1) TaxID=930990 RepID=A0A067MF18_BOTB1|nr:hypothetical protein BOTBODRAFT_36153 [Botryobasidium botryosum FD-172 SS1]